MPPLQAGLQHLEQQGRRDGIDLKQVRQTRRVQVIQLLLRVDAQGVIVKRADGVEEQMEPGLAHQVGQLDRKSTRLNSSHVRISYAVFCLKKKKKKRKEI